MNIKNKKAPKILQLNLKSNDGIFWQICIFHEYQLVYFTVFHSYCWSSTYVSFLKLHIAFCFTVACTI